MMFQNKTNYVLSIEIMFLFAYNESELTKAVAEMLGFSIFLGETLTEDKKRYILAMKQAGFTRIFTSLHIPEEDPQKVINTLQQLGLFTQKLHIDLMADISSDGLQRLSIDLNQAGACENLKQLGITGIRMDYGIDNQTIAAVSQQMKVGLNASTLSEEDVEQLASFQADFTKMELWHNYYPRPETGLSSEYLQTVNHKWQTLGSKIVAFVAGDENLRGPLYKGLPTLEKHRNQHPLAAALDLFYNYGCDIVHIGDGGLSKKVKEQFNVYFKQKKMLLEVDLLLDSYRALVLGEHTNRIDEAQDVIRSQESRRNNRQTIEAENNQLRDQGSVTIDNKNYQRYMGEMQITKRKLPADKKVNVVAKITKKDRELVHYIGSGCRFELREGRKRY